MYRMTKPLVISQGAFQLVATMTEFVPTLAMQQIVDFVSAYKGEAVPSRVILFVVLLFVGPVVQGVADGRNFHLGRRIGCRVRRVAGGGGGGLSLLSPHSFPIPLPCLLRRPVAHLIALLQVRSSLVGAVFQKMLRTDMSHSNFSSGELTNLMSVDTSLVMEFSPYTHFLWATTLQLLVSIALLFYILGLSALGGVAFMLLSVPLGKWTTTRTQGFQKVLMKKKDERMSVVGEVMQGMRIIKLFAWEKDFKRKMAEARRSEMRSLRNYMVGALCI
ncbi:unnamed protein product, partial [Discosporangium mesarthrocarpum]